jgi:phosphoenolpyruvate carboxylase
MRVLRHAENASHDTQESYDNLEKRWNELTEYYHLQVQRIADLEEVLSKSVNKEEAEKIKNYNERLQTELTETRAGLFSYKNMTEVIAD